IGRGTLRLEGLPHVSTARLFMGSSAKQSVRRRTQAKLNSSGAGRRLLSRVSLAIGIQPGDHILLLGLFLFHPPLVFRAHKSADLWMADPATKQRLNFLGHLRTQCHFSVAKFEHFAIRSMHLEPLDDARDFLLLDSKES